MHKRDLIEKTEIKPTLEKISEEEEPKNVEFDKKVFLKSDEMLQLQQQIHEIEKNNYQMKITAQDLEIASLRIENAKRNVVLLEQRQKELQGKVKNQTLAAQGSKVTHKKCLDELRLKYNIPVEKWGFDPDTGAIIC
jgi:hypothetical protein